MSTTTDDEVETEENCADNYEGDPVICPECNERVAVTYKPLEEYARPGGWSAFELECACDAMGPRLDDQTVGHMYWPWFPSEIDRRYLTQCLPGRKKAGEILGDE